MQAEFDGLFPAIKKGPRLMPQAFIFRTLC